MNYITSYSSFVPSPSLFHWTSWLSQRHWRQNCNVLRIADDVGRWAYTALEVHICAHVRTTCFVDHTFWHCHPSFGYELMELLLLRINYF